MDGPAPAIVNAVEDALKVPFDSIPLLPEDIFEALTDEPRAAACRRSAMTEAFSSENPRAMRSLIHRKRRVEDRARYPMERLLDVLRHQLELTGAKEGCGEGECGSCSVLLNGASGKQLPGSRASSQDANIVTIEGLGG